MKRALALGLWLFARAAFAHAGSDSYLLVDVANEKVSARWDLSLRDLDALLFLDADDDGKLTWGEVRAGKSRIETAALSALATDGCAFRVNGPLQLVDHAGARYASLPLELPCPLQGALTYTYYFDRDPGHRGLARLLDANGAQTFVFSAGQTQWRPQAVDAGFGFTSLVKTGMHHIFEGYDHLLFLLALLLPAVLRRESGRWEPVPAFAPALGEVVKTVTAFTVAHSVTLSLAALGFVGLPTRWVESAIAASVVLAALNNLFPLIRTDRWVASFALGLLHGFGFSSVLAGLDLPQAGHLATLLGFNLGVEVGQLMVVAVALPVAFVLRRSRLYEKGVLTAGSAATALVAFAWFVERAWEVSLLP